MAKSYFCDTHRGVGTINIEKTSEYPFKINEVRILTKDGDVNVNLINAYKTALKIYVKNNNDSTNEKHNLRRKSTFIDNYRYYPNVNLCSNQTFIVKSSNKLNRPYNITISGYEDLPETSATDSSLLAYSFATEKSKKLNGSGTIAPADGTTFYVIEFHNDTAISNMIVADGWSNYTGITMPEGSRIITNCTSITISSGFLTAYQRSVE